MKVIFDGEGDYVEVPTDTTRAEARALEYAETLVSEGYDLEKALARARTAYGLAAFFGKIEIKESRKFQKDKIQEIIDSRPDSNLEMEGDILDPRDEQVKKALREKAQRDLFGD